MSSNLSIVTVGLNPAIDRVIEVPGLKLGQHVVGKHVQRLPAGKAINVSRVLAMLGRDSVATGFVGHEQFAEFDERLRSAGPGRALCQLLTVPGRTRENITLIDPVDHIDTHIRDRGFDVSEQDVTRMTSKIGLLSRPGVIIVFSGSLPPGVSQDALRRMVATARHAGARTVLDLAGRDLRSLLSLGGSDPADPADQQNRQPQSAQPPGHFLIKPNLEELADLVGRSSLADDPDKAISAAAGLTGVSTWIALTLGDAGAALIGAEGAWRGRVEIDPDRISSTVGCGDAMLAGLLDGFSSNLPPQEALRRGLAAATANAMTAGVAELNRADLQEAVDAAEVTKAFAARP